jgi:hypothetical protein
VEDALALPCECVGEEGDRVSRVLEVAEDDDQVVGAGREPAGEGGEPPGDAEWRDRASGDLVSDLARGRRIGLL